MISIIVTGHGDFAKGMLSAVRLVAGEQKELYAVNFAVEHSTDDLRGKISTLLAQCGDEVLVLTDIAGGSPFNTSVSLRATTTDRHIEVLSGANLPILLAAVMDRNGQSLDKLCASLLETGQRSIKQFRLRQPVVATPEEDGI